MKKILSIAVVLMLVAGVAVAGWEVNAKKSFSGSGNTTSATIDKGNGTIVCDQMSAWVATNKAITVYRPDADTTMYLTNSSAVTNITLYTSSSNKVEGYSLTASDSILVADTSGTGWQLAGLASVGAVSTNSKGKVIATAYTLDSSVSFASNDVVYVCKNAETLSYGALPTNTLVTIYDAFSGYLNNPVHLTVGSGSGDTTFLTGTCSIQK